MSWKKSVFSRLVWVVYLLIIGTAMAFAGSAICGGIGVAEYIGGVAAVAYLLFAGLIVFVLRRTATKLKSISYGRGKDFQWIESILAALLFVAGLFLRAKEMRADVDSSVFLDLAYVSSDGQTIPWLAHGAVYFYIWTLRIVFLLLGNKAAMALWLQIMLQMLGVLLLYYAVRKMAGKLPAIMMLVFFMLSSYMVEKAIVPSPEMFYLLLFSIVLLYVSRGVDHAFRWLFWLLAGVMAALLIYLDVAGLLLIPLMIGAIVTRRKEAKRKIKSGILGVVAGLLLGVLSCVLVGALSSSKSVLGFMEEWMQLYRFEEPQFAVILSEFDMVWLMGILLCLMAWGVFSPWHGRKTERFSIWIICLLVAALLQCLGIFVEEMSGGIYIFLFSTILAGLGVRESIVVPVEEISFAEAMEKKTISSDAAVKEQPKLQELGEKDATETKETLKDAKAAAEISQTTVEAKETLEADERSEEKQEQKQEPEETREIEYIENPLPLPKAHVKRVMDYELDFDPDYERDLGGYDIYVPDDDDFDH